MRRSTFIVFAVLTVISLMLSACAPASTPTQAAETQVQAPTNATQPTQVEEAEPTTAAPEATMANEPEAPADGVMLTEVNPGEVTGNIISAGSSTVFPLTEAIATLFEEEGYQGQVTVDSIGSGAGLERFCKAGETDIANASRAIKDSEIEDCNAIGREPIEFRVGTDAIALVVNPENDFLTNVTMDELAIIFSDQAENWSDVNPDWPAEPIKRYAPGTDSGTYDFFIEEVLQPRYDKDVEKARTAFQNAKNLQQSEDDNVLVQGVEGDKYAIGFFGFAYYQEQAEKLKAVSLDGVEPNFETAEDGSYGLSRPLFIYSDAKIMQEKPQVAAFINFYLTRVNEVIEEVGYFPASADALDAARQGWIEANGEEAPADGVMLPEINPGEVTGNIISAGSSTVFPLTEAIATLFEEEGYQGQVTVDSIGSGAGLERFCKAGETDIANASRAIKDSEIEDCNAIGREPIEFRVGTDAIALVVNPENDFLTNVTMDELAIIFSDQAENWSDVNPDWPAEPIKRYAPGTDSGTYDFFIEVVLQPKYDKDVEKARTAFQNAKNLQQSEDDNVLVQGVEGDKYAIGFFGFAYYQEQADKLKAVSLDDVEPNFETAEDGSYGLSRPLFIYSDAKIMQEKPQVAAFINFYLTRVNEVIEDVGYFPASAEALDASRQGWIEANGE